MLRCRQRVDIVAASLTASPGTIRAISQNASYWRGTTRIGLFLGRPARASSAHLSAG